MRHLWSSLAGLLAAPVVWVLVALGQQSSTRTVNGWEERGVFNTADLIEPAAYLTVAGVLLGLIATLRVSPTGPLVAGVLLAGPYAAMFADPFQVHDALPADREILGEPLALRPPLDNGTLLLVGVLLLMAVFSTQRWRRWPKPATAPSVEADTPAAPVLGMPGASPTTPDTPDTEPWRRPPPSPVSPAAATPPPAPTAPTALTGATAPAAPTSPAAPAAPAVPVAPAAAAADAGPAASVPVQRAPIGKPEPLTAAATSTDQTASPEPASPEPDAAHKPAVPGRAASVPATSPADQPAAAEKAGIESAGPVPAKPGDQPTAADWPPAAAPGPKPEPADEAESTGKAGSAAGAEWTGRTGQSSITGGEASPAGGPAPADTTKPKHRADEIGADHDAVDERRPIPRPSRAAANPPPAESPWLAPPRPAQRENSTE